MSSTIVLAVNDLDFGGAQRTVIEEANELFRRGESVYVLTTLSGRGRGLAPLLRIPKERVVHIPFQSLYDREGYRTLISFLKPLQPRVLSNLFFTNTILRVAKIFSPHFSVVVREGNVIREKEIGALFADLCLSLVTKRVLGNSKKVVSSVRWLSPFAPVTLLYNGIGSNFFNTPSTEERTRARSFLGVSDRTVLIVAVGSLTEKKGYPYLIHAFQDVFLKNPHTKLFILGEGHLISSLKALAQEVCPEGIAFLGGGSARNLLAAGDMYALSSLWEGMPNTLLEAMAMGLPSVATDVGGVSEILENSVNGFLVAAGDTDMLASRLSELV